MEDLSLEQSVESYSVKLSVLVDEFKLEVIYAPEDFDSIEVSSFDVNRPGLPLNGFFDHFDKKRIQLIGNAEHHFLSSLEPEKRLDTLNKIFEKKIPALVVTASLPVFDELIAAAKNYGIPLLRTDVKTSRFQSSVISSLSVHLAPRIQIHGVFVEVYGEGILILGDSGVGKSENAIELVKRGHRLIADDAVILKKVSDKTLVGSSPDVIRHYVELRGIGIVDIRRLFGYGSIKETEKVNLIINLKKWNEDISYDRLGLEQEKTSILGLEIPTYTVPVSPGRNLAIIIEIAALENRQRRSGYNTAEEFNKNLMEHLFNNK